MICQKPRETLVVTTPLQVTGLAITTSTMSHLMQAVGAQQQSQNNVWAEEFQTSTGHKVNTNALPHPALASLVTLFRPERL
jgi:hypothetical protein